jgi:hypothetical protein
MKTILEMIAPNGKPLGECTREDLMQIRDFHQEVLGNAESCPPWADSSPSILTAFRRWREEKRLAG